VARTVIFILRNFGLFPLNQFDCLGSSHGGPQLKTPVALLQGIYLVLAWFRWFNRTETNKDYIAVKLTWFFNNKIFLISPSKILIYAIQKKNYFVFSMRLTNDIFVLFVIFIKNADVN